MAQYRLNESLLFDDETFQLGSLASPQSPIKLSATASRCLKLFIERQGETVDKETLMHECWGKYGSLVTEGSMWKNISQLRQAFQNLNIPFDVIVTVPRLGYTFTSQIQVELLAPSVRVTVDEPLPDLAGVSEVTPLDSPVNDTQPESIPQHTALPHTPATIPRRGIPKVALVICTILVLLNAIAAAGYYLYQSDAKKLGSFDTSEQYRPMASDGDTKVFLQSPLTEESSYAKVALKRFYDEKPQTLAGKSVNYLYINKVTSHVVSSYFLCDRPISENDNGCSAYFSLKSESTK